MRIYPLLSWLPSPGTPLPPLIPLALSGMMLTVIK